jgi:flavin reductase (DIM6/NTAB) family NADH-FMN oxidoreductase RutF
MKDLDPFLKGADTPMYVVTTVHRDTGERAGCLVGFASQCSIQPDLFAVWLSQRNHTYRVAMDADFLAVHGLAATQRPLAVAFGSRTGDEVDKFADCDWRAGPSGVPILDGCPRWFAGRVHDRMAWGNHTAFLLEPVEVASASDVAPLLLSAVDDLTPGHEA